MMITHNDVPPNIGLAPASNTEEALRQKHLAIERSTGILDERYGDQSRGFTVPGRLAYIQALTALDERTHPKLIFEAPGAIDSETSRRPGTVNEPTQYLGQIAV